MIRILHVVDRWATWEQLTTLQQLIEHLPADRYDQRVEAVGSKTSKLLSTRNIAYAQRSTLFSSPSKLVLQTPGKKRPFDLVHTWSGTFKRGNFNINFFRRPSEIDSTTLVLDSKHSLAQGSPIGFSSKQRETMVSPAAPITTKQNTSISKIQAELSISTGSITLLTPPLNPSTVFYAAQRDSYLAVVWSAGMQAYGNPNTKIIIPGKSRAIKKLRKLANVTETRGSFIFTEDRYRFEHLCQLADILVLGPGGDVSVPAIAWAMASDTIVIAPDCAASREVINDGVNGILYEQKENWRRSATSIASMYGKCQSETGRNIRGEAKKTAENEFSLPTMIENYRRLYDETASA